MREQASRAFQAEHASAAEQCTHAYAYPHRLTSSGFAAIAPAPHCSASSCKHEMVSAIPPDICLSSTPVHRTLQVGKHEALSSSWCLRPSNYVGQRLAGCSHPALCQQMRCRMWELGWRHALKRSREAASGHDLKHTCMQTWGESKVATALLHLYCSGPGRCRTDHRKRTSELAGGANAGAAASSSLLKSSLPLLCSASPRPLTLAHRFAASSSSLEASLLATWAACCGGACEAGFFFFACRDELLLLTSWASTC